MRLFHRKRRPLSIWLLTMLVATQFITIFAMPLPAQAKTLETSADPSDEIVYIDPDGVIRVIDTQTNQGDPLVGWFSPSGGWEYVTLGDVNNDGDMEIAALGRNGNFVKVGVFDPVVTSGVTDPNKEINGIPWDILYEVEFPGIPSDIIAGNFDDNVPGAELAIIFRDGSNNYHLRIWKAATLDNQGNATGRTWQDHIVRDWEDEKYYSGAAGQLVGEGADELVLVDEDSEETRMDLFAVDRDMERLDGNSTDTDRYRQAIIGQPIEDGNEEVGARISTDRADKPSAIVYEINDDQEFEADEDSRWAFAPQPNHIFFADIFGNGDDEFFVLRDHPDDEGARLIMRDDWGEDRDRFDDDYDIDLDGIDYEVAEGGDIDGDGKDEIVLLREDRITILTRPEDRAEDEAYISTYTVPTDDDTLALGNLDAVGFILGPTFGVSQSMFEVAVPTGTQSESYSFTVTNISTADPITFQIFLSGGADWVVLDRTTATTPATINMRFNATNRPVATYEATMTLQSAQQEVLNEPYEIKLVMDVLPAVIEPRPQTAAFIHYPCNVDPEGPMSMTVRLEGTAGLNYRGAVIGVPGETAAAAVETFRGEVAGGEIDEDGNMVLYDVDGNRRVIETGQVSASAALTTAWYIDDSVSSWIKNVYSEDNTVPSNLTVEVDLTDFDANFPVQQAIFVMVADTRAGDPPDNVYGLPIVAICAAEQLALPAVR